mgnify:CR=1 FL=1
MNKQYLQAPSSFLSPTQNFNQLALNNMLQQHSVGLNSLKELYSIRLLQQNLNALLMRQWQTPLNFPTYLPSDTNLRSQFPLSRSETIHPPIHNLLRQVLC